MPMHQGKCPPAYAITPVIPAMGTEYMFVGLGCGVVGTYSLATGLCMFRVFLISNECYKCAGVCACM